MPGRAAILFLLTAVLAAPARAEPTELMPGVFYDRTVQFTPHGAVVLNVLTAPRPGDQNGLYGLVPVLARGAVAGGAQRLTEIERQASAGATVAGIEGDLFRATDGIPSGIVLQGGVLAHPPNGSRSSIGVDTAGGLHVDRVRFFGTWQGTGQRRTLATLNQPPAPGETALFTPAYGPRAPAAAGVAQVVLAPFPVTVPNADLTATVTGTGSGGGIAIPPGGAVLLAAGAAAAKVQAEAPVGATVRLRLGLQPSWTGVGTALGGGPALVRNGRPVFRSLEDFTNDQVSSRSPRAAVGQLADGRIVLVAVDGGRPGYSVGLTSFELAQALVRLGAVTAAGVAPGDAVTMAFDGTLLNRPSGTAELPVREALLVQYAGVYAPPPPIPLLTGEPGRTTEPLAYRLVRPSTVTARLVGPDGAPRTVETAVAHTPGTYPFTAATFDREGTWHWTVAATDDLGRQSTADRVFRYDTTLRSLAVSPGKGRATLRFLLGRPARVAVSIETPGGTPVASLRAASLQAGAGALTWDGLLPQGARAYPGTYVAHLTVTSEVGTSDLDASFRFRR
jgi:hypothetical protein